MENKKEKHRQRTLRLPKKQQHKHIINRKEHQNSKNINYIKHTAQFMIKYEVKIPCNNISPRHLKQSLGVNEIPSHFQTIHSFFKNSLVMPNTCCS
ncbi:hypothetical protein Scep_026779 [Stephania cephalantha]|uniref:Uncharacterized protein n=1 Tax=Stephania cephalantha TaxID=152367 RepID=A0AAP0HTL7_9MAGN